MFEEMNRRQEADLKDLRDATNFRIKELEKMMEDQFKDEVNIQSWSDIENFYFYFNLKKIQSLKKTLTSIKSVNEQLNADLQDATDKDSKNIREIEIFLLKVSVWW